MKFKINKNLTTFLYRIIIIAIIGFVTSFPLYSKASKILIKSENIHIYGNSFISKDTLINKILNNLDDKSIYDIDFLKIKKKILDIEYLNDCKISSILPSDLIIEIVEESPIALIKNLNNYNYINLDGKLLSYDPKYENRFNVPKVVFKKSQLNGIINSIEFNSGQLYYLQILKNNDLLQNLDKIVISEKELELIDVSGTKIFIDNRKFNYSIKLLTIFKDQISKIKKISDYEYINLKLDNQIIVKERI